VGQGDGEVDSRCKTNDLSAAIAPVGGRSFSHVKLPPSQQRAQLRDDWRGQQRAHGDQQRPLRTSVQEPSLFQYALTPQTHDPPENVSPSSPRARQSVL